MNFTYGYVHAKSRVLSIINTNKNAVTNVHLRKHLRQLGYRHSTWAAHRFVVNGNTDEDINEYRPPNDSGDSGDDNDSASDEDSDNNNDSGDNEDEASDIAVENNNNNNNNSDDSNEFAYVNIHSELLTNTHRRNRYELLRLQQIQRRQNNNNNDSEYERGENDQ